MGKEMLVAIHSFGGTASFAKHEINWKNSPSHLANVLLEWSFLIDNKKGNPAIRNFYKQLYGLLLT